MAVISVGDEVVSVLFAVAYAGMLVGWGLNWYQHRTHAGVSLHKFIGITLLLQFVVVLFLSIYWGTHDIHQSDIGPVGDTTNCLSILAQAIFFALLILVAKGWCITHQTLHYSFKLSVFCFVVAYIILEVLAMITGRWLQVLVSIIILGMFIGLLFYVVSTTNANIRTLINKMEVQQHSIPTAVPTEGAPSSESSIAMSELPPPQQMQPAPSSSPYPQPFTYPAQTYPPPQPHYSTVSPQVSITQAPNNSNPNTIYVAPAQNTTNTNDNEHNPEAQEKLRLFQVYHKLIMFYIVTFLVLFFLPSFKPSALHVFVYLRMLLVLVFLGGLCFIFRLRTVNHYFYLVLPDEM